jgi:hypothetical protein
MNVNEQQRPNKAYALVHLDINNETEVLSSSVVGKSFIQAMTALKHHPCTRGAIYEYDDRVPFHCDAAENKRVAEKCNNVIVRVQK